MYYFFSAYILNIIFLIQEHKNKNLKIDLVLILIPLYILNLDNYFFLSICFLLSLADLTADSPAFTAASVSLIAPITLPFLILSIA